MYILYNLNEIEFITAVPVQTDMGLFANMA